MWSQHQRMGRHRTRRIVAGGALVALVSACGGSPPSPAPAAASLDDAEIVAALKGFQGSAIKQHMSVLADDALEGRGLGTAGLRGRAALRRDDGHSPTDSRRPARTAASGSGCRSGTASSSRTAARCRCARRRRTKTLVYGKDYLLGADPLRERGQHRGCAGRVRRLRRQRPGARLRRLRGRRGREGQGGGVPERRAGDAARATSAPTTRRVR